MSVRNTTLGTFLAGTTIALASLLTAGTAYAQSDPLEQLKARQKIAEQRTEYSVQEALREAEKIARVSPTRAIEALRKVRLSLDLSTEIGSAKREELVRQLDSRIAVLQGAPATGTDQKARSRRESNQKELAAAQAEAKEVREAVSEIGKLFEANRQAEGQKKLADVLRKYPDNPALLELSGLGALAGRVARARDLAREQSERMLAVANGLDKSSLPPKYEMEFPENWKELSERRKQLEPKLMGPEEEAVLAALDKIVTTGVNNAPFEETLQSLSNLINQPIYLDKQSLEDAGMNLQRPVSIPANVSARTALRGILQSQGLTFIIKDKVIQVLTIERARETLVTRAYYLGDVITMVGPFSGGATWGPLTDAQQTQANAKFIIDAIKASVDPLAWDTKHGPSTIVFHYPSLSLIVRAPSEVHVTLGRKIGPSR